MKAYCLALVTLCAPACESRGAVRGDSGDAFQRGDAFVVHDVDGSGVSVDGAILPRDGGIVSTSPKVIGHRGAAGLFPENTVLGFRKAIALGVHGVEFDVQMSADGVPVLMHDATVDRTTDGTGAVADLTFDELRALDAGQGEVIPTLDEALAALPPELVILCELKGPGTEEAALEAVRRSGLMSSVFFTSFHLDRIERIQHLDSTVRIGALLNDVEDASVAAVLALNAELVNVHHVALTQPVVDTLHRSDRLVRAFNPDLEAEQRRVVELGIDFLGTNRPDVAFSWMAGQN